ncbi:MAG TPA: enoyl-CoA hydratase/isomerase family protein [bacterium]|nr:enoyl-CoA hydratase/isomerase family protein [bacterium]
MQAYPLDIARQQIAAAGMDATAGDWLQRIATRTFPEPAAAEGLASDAAALRGLVEEGWALLDKLPLRSRRSAAEMQAGEQVVRQLADLQWRFLRSYREPVYRQLTADFSRCVRVDDLCWRAAELWPGLAPTREQVREESRRMQIDKDGREIAQGVLVSQFMTDPRIGTHLLMAMQQPTEEALERLGEFIAKGRLDLGTVHVEARGGCGYLYFAHPRYLNAEDDDTLGPQEVATDLILMHPDLKMGVLRGEPVEHPKYKGRRIFSAGLNLTRLYHGKLSFLFYLVRDLGLVNKLYRGHTQPDFRLDEPDDTHEKPWLAVLEAFAIGGGCQLLLVMDYVIAEQGAYFNLPARKEGIIPGAANLRLPRFVGEAVARDGIMFDRTFSVDEPVAASLINEVHPADSLDAAVQAAVDNAVGSGMVSAGGNRKAIRVQTEPLDRLREYMAVYSREQAFCHLSEQLTYNLEKHWQAKQRRL